MKIGWLIGSYIDINILLNTSEKMCNSGGWVYTQLIELSKNDLIDEIIIISINNNYSKNDFVKIDKFKIYSLKFKTIDFFINKKMYKSIDKIVESENIDILDIQGTETNISGYNIYKNTSVPIVTTIHGVAYQINKFFFLGLPPFYSLFHRSIHDNLTFTGSIEAKILMSKRRKLEKRVLESSKYVRGRTNWDMESVFAINNNLRYFKVELIMRDYFYDRKWNINDCEKNRIFISQVNIPYKGFFMLLDALAILKKRIKNFNVYIPGYPIKSGFKAKGYEKYIWKKIKKYGLKEKIHFLGQINAEEVTNQLMRARIFVLPSMIENSPNSLVEAQLVGTPCVSSLVGGVGDYIKNNVSGLLYNCMDSCMCANSIYNLMTNDDLSIKISNQAREDAFKRHNRYILTKELISCYETIIKSEEKR